MKTVIDNLGKVSLTVEKEYWTSSKDYDKLVIVEVEGSYRTYLSRKPVPAGISYTDRRYWIPFSSLQEEIVLNYNSWLNRYGALVAGVESTVNDIQESFNYINTHLPDGVYFKGDVSEFEAGTEVNCTLQFYSTSKKLAHCKIYKNDVLIIEEDATETEWVVKCTEDTIIRLEATIDNYIYYGNWSVKAIIPSYGGASANYIDIVNEAHKLCAKADITGVYTFEVTEDGQYFYLVVPTYVAIDTITMNGFEIPFDLPVEVVIDGIIHKMYKSQNAYVEGSYEIVINQIHAEPDIAALLEDIENTLANLPGEVDSDENTDGTQKDKVIIV